MKLTVAMVQQPAFANQPEENLALAVELIGRCSALGADLVLFPEMWLNGYAPPFPTAFENPFDPRYRPQREAWLAQAVPPDGRYVRTLQQAARQHGVGVVATCLLRGEDGPGNAALVIDDKGALLLTYRKVHTCAFSLEALLQPGREFEVCTFRGVCLGVMICFDREFPESARVLMLKGAEILLVPNACDMNPARLGQLSARAFENMAGVAMANYPGPGWGRSCAFSPVVFDEQGRYQDPTLAMGGEGPQLLLVDFDLDAIRRYRQREVWGNAFRRPAAYGPLLQAEVAPPFVRRVPREK